MSHMYAEPPPSYETIASNYTSSYIHPPQHTSHGNSAPRSNRQRPKLNEVRLTESVAETKKLEELAELYAIIKVTQSLEAVFSRGSVSNADYEKQCLSLINQYKATVSALMTSSLISSPEAFFRDYVVDCPRAYERLVVYGVPATLLNLKASSDTRGESVVVAETVQAFITAMDALKLDRRAVDEVQPLIADVMNSLTRVPRLSQQFEGLTRLQLWLQKLNQMRAVDSLSEDEARQLLYDLDSSYTAFHRHLSNH